MGTLHHVDPKMVVCTASFACYLFYKQFEPTSPLVHAILLLVAPGILAVLLGAQLSLAQQIVAVIPYWTSILAFTALYRLSPLHPLAKYPGPALGKLSKFWLAYHNARGDAFQVIKRLHDQYGDVVRVGPNELSFRTADALQPVYAAKTLPKGPYYDSRNNHEDLTQLDGVRDFQIHSARRKPWIKAMGPAGLKEYDTVVVQKVHELVEELAKRQGEVIDLRHWMTLYGFDFMGHLAFGRDFGMIKSGRDTNGLIHVVEGGVYGAGVISQIPWILPILKLIPAANKGLEALQRMSAEFASGRTKDGAKIKDLFYYFTEDEAAAQTGATPGEIVADGMLAIIAGSDTTSTVLSHLLYYMLRHPACAERLRKEIDEAFPHGEDPVDFSRQAEMPYLNACLNETLRLLPPTLSGLQRSVPRGSGGAMIGPHFVPAGTQLFVHFYSLHRDSRSFSPLPDTFWPERWLTQDTYTLPSGEALDRAHVTTNRAAFVPFSLGPQNCAGRALAMLEMRAVACGLLQRFALRPAPGFDLDEWERNLKDVYITITGPLPGVVVPRHTER